jgi:hypothetical protein
MHLTERDEIWCKKVLYTIEFYSCYDKENFQEYKFFGDDGISIGIRI